MILDWFENLPKDERPPSWMWHLDEKLIEHFEWVESQREARMRGDHREMPDLEQNEMTKGWRR